MTGTAWGLVALAGLALVAVANLLRFRRTGDRGCLGHVLVPSDQLAAPELVLNRLGIAAFVGGVVLSLLA